MYGYEWTKKYGIYHLISNAKVIKEIRPVFKEELDYFGMNAHWNYPNTNAPILWAEGIRRYNLNGECVAEAVGGGFYSKPVIRIQKSRDKLKLKAVNINDLWKENERLMIGLEKTALEFIRKVHDDYEKRGMQFVVAFSGGKDSLVLLDLVAKTLRPDEFYVIFGNTGMELTATLEAVDRVKKHYPTLRFFESSSHMTPEETWDAFGPPGRRLRWCCSVHKSVPTILKLREITGDYDARAVVFDGVRHEESAARAMYGSISEGAKNINQVNVSPIIEWGTAEIYLYLLKKGLFFNDAYRYGIFRCGCKVCPMSSAWWEGITTDVYRGEIASLLSRVETYAENTKAEKERQKYVESGGWKGRMGGRGVKGGGNRVTEVIDGDKIIFGFSKKTNVWLDVCKTLGTVLKNENNSYIQVIDHQSYNLMLTNDTVTYSPYSAMDRFTISHLRGVANKVAYCVGCKACVVQCPTGAFEITRENNILIRDERCTHCSNCIEFTETKGCIAAKSLYTTGGYGMNLKGMNRYQHFGFRRLWLEHFFEYGTDCFTMGHLGNRQYDSLRVWLREAGLLTPSSKGEKSGVSTVLCERLKLFGAGNPLVWAIIWTNLAYSSIITKWYMIYAQIAETYSKAELVFLLGDDYSQSTRDNAVTALFETLRHSPIGAVLKQGVPIQDGASYKFLRQGWDNPEAIAILYALYKYAEETGKYATTLTAFEATRSNSEVKGVDPVSIFGLNPTKFKEILQDIAIAYPDHLRVVFQQDLDNVVLVPDKKAIEILDLVAEQ